MFHQNMLPYVPKRGGGAHLRFETALRLLIGGHTIEGIFSG